MGMSNYILDCVEEFWSKCLETIGECETVEEWEAVMKPHEHLLLGLLKIWTPKSVVMMVCGMTTGQIMSKLGIDIEQKIGAS